MMHKEKATTIQMNEWTAKKIFSAGAWRNFAASKRDLHADDSKMMRATRLYPRIYLREVLANYELYKLQYDGTEQTLEELGQLFGRILYLETFSARDQVPEDLQDEVKELSQLAINTEFKALWYWLCERLS